jgi:hypothetical protein
VSKEHHLLALLVLGTLPAVVLGFVFERWLRHLFGSPSTGALILLLNGVVLFAGERLRGPGDAAADRRGMAEAGWRYAILINLFQAAALFPGISRSGATMVGGLVVGLRHEDAARFSFLLARPVIIGGNTAHTTKSTLATPLFQNNQTILNVIYTYNSAPWTITPYFQYTNVPAASSIGAFTSASTYGGAILANYSFAEGSPLPGVSLPVRFEYIASTGSAANGAANLLYGPGSKAWSVTVTPTYQYKIYFARVEFSHVGANSTTPGLAFGPGGTNTTQTRAVAEVGILF